MATKLGDRIKKLRKDIGLTIEELAKKTESSKSYIWELENKSISKPSAEKLSRIASVLGVTTDYLVANEKKDAVVSAKDEVFIKKYKSLKPEQKEKYRKLMKLLDDE